MSIVSDVLEYAILENKYLSLGAILCGMYNHVCLEIQY